MNCTDGSVWSLDRALTDRKYQQFDPPFEARQTFAYTLVEDSNNVWPEVEEAVVKVKYQYVLGAGH